MLAGLLCEATYLGFVVAVVAAAASLVRSILSTVGIALGVLILLSVLGGIAAPHDWLPSTLAGAPATLLPAPARPTSSPHSRSPPPRRWRCGTRRAPARPAGDMRPGRAHRLRGRRRRRRGMMSTMGAYQDRNIVRIREFYDSGPAATDEQRRGYFADTFVWHVPGDTDLSGPYRGETYFIDMPARMQPLDEWRLDIDTIAANDDLVIASGRTHGPRLGREITATAGHVFRLDESSRIVEAWGWCADQVALDRFFAGD